MKNLSGLRSVLPGFREASAVLVVALASACGGSSPQSTSPTHVGGSGGNTTTTSGGSTSNGGGATSSGGSTSTSSGGDTTAQGGADMPAPHMLLACPTAPSAVGVWEAMNPNGIQIPAPQGMFGASMLVLNPQDYSVVVAYDHHGIYKSSDCGANWTKLNTGRNGDVIDTGSSWTMVIDPVNPQTIYANNGYGMGEGVFKSTNGGVDWDQTIAPGSDLANAAAYVFATRISMDPTNHNHLVVAFHSGCSGAAGSNCLGETTDGGSTWKVVPLSAGGAEASGVAVIDSKTWIYGGTGNGLWITKDSGANWKMVNSDGGYIYYKSKAGVYYIGAQQGILSSSDLMTWTMNNGGNNVTGIASDGETMYAGKRYCYGGATCYLTSPENDGVNWTDIQTPAVKDQGALAMGYDPDHHIMYSANEAVGAYRVLLH